MYSKKTENSVFFRFSICNNLENKLTTNRGKDIDLINALQKTKESSLQTNSRFDEVKFFYLFFLSKKIEKFVVFIRVQID